jgi:ferredoxin-NADP reductase
MKKHIIKIIDTQYVTHDVKKFTCEKPSGYSFIPGQATDVLINKEKWRNEERPFTFTSLNDWPQLEFTTKIYRSHEGVTNELGKLKPDDELLIGDPWGAISYKGPGVFIAGGAGITPFIAILRQLKVDRKIKGNALIFSNKTSADVIYKEELSHILGKDLHIILTREQVLGFLDRRIDREMLIDIVKDFDQHFYICGPDKFVTDINLLLKDLGATSDSVIVEE